MNTSRGRWVLVVLVLLLVAAGAGYWRYRSGNPVASGGLTVYCAAGLKAPVEIVASEYQKQFCNQVALSYGGSGALVSTQRVAKQGDLLILADGMSLAEARKYDLVNEVIPFARQHLVLAVIKGNPKSIRTLADLARPGMRFGIVNPETASAGKVLKRTLGEGWTDFFAKVTVMKPTVMDAGNDAALGAVDAAVVWDSTVAQWKDKLDAVEVPELAQAVDHACIAVLAVSRQPTEALRFARFLASPQFGNPVLARCGFKPIVGDDFVPQPTMVFYSGGVNRLAIEKTIGDFATRERAKVTTAFNGCGILCATMRTMAKNPSAALPDAYYACDICFVPPVADLYPEAVVLTETDIVIAVPKGNPRHL
ncbi:MAG: substrate-binding domain-containing protein, partial [Phycisphaerae bacterium]